MNPVALDPLLVEWAQSEIGGRVASVRIAASGFARLTAILDFAGGTVPSAVLRHDTGAGVLAGTPFSLRHEGLALRAVAGRGLAVPRLLAASADGRTLLVEKAEGAVAQAHEALPDLLDQLGRLHALDPDDLPLDGFTAPGLHDLDGWEAIYRGRVGRRVPILELAFPLLRAATPAADGRPVLCHGDPGAGNYLVAGGRVTALLDWELSHLGDPMDDLAWLTIRANQLGLAIDDFAGLVERHWRPASGLRPDPDRLRYWQAVGLMRMLVMCLAGVAQSRQGRERLIQMTIVPVFESQLIAALAGLAGVALPPAGAPSAAELIAALPAAELAEVAEDLNDTFLPLAAGTHLDPWLRRIRNLLRQVGAQGAAFAAARPLPEVAPGEAGLAELFRRSQARLAWQPRAAALAALPLASLDPWSAP